MVNTQKSLNVVDFNTFINAARNPDLRFTVSSRGIRPDIDMSIYLNVFYMYLNLGQIQSVFGNTIFQSMLYGGRPFDISYALTDAHLRRLEGLKINLALNLTNHYFNEDVYQHSNEFLEHHHKPGNTINVVSDKLARRLRNDFPDYTLNASIIKNLNTQDKIRRGLDMYDFVVIPMQLNDDDEFLEGLLEKQRIILFGNARCAYNCPARTCYIRFSQEIQGKPVTADCSKDKIPRPDLGMIHFDLEKLSEMGFTTFKLIPNKSEQIVKEFVARTLQNARAASKAE